MVAFFKQLMTSMMLLIRVFLIFSLSFLSNVIYADNSINENDFPSNSIITRDVLIIGGGSSGTYSAIRLQQQGKSVVVVEKEAVLGGHTNTYIDPVTNARINYGVQVWENIPVVTNYLSYLGVPLITVNESSSPFVDDVADFSTGTVVPESSLPPTNLAAAIQDYAAQLAKYPYLDDGFDLPSPVPDDLLLQFGDFLSNTKLQALASLAFQYSQGVGNILAQPTLYIMKYFSSPILAGIANGFLAAASHDNHQLYDQALSVLGTDVLLNSTPSIVERDGGGIIAVVSTPSGPILVKATKLIVAIPPKLENLGFLDLDDNESGVFSLFNNSYYWTSVVRNSGVPDNTSISAVSFTAPDGVPAMPDIYDIEATGVPELHTVYYGSSYAISDDQVQSNILSALAEVVKAAGFPPASGPATIVAFKDHSPFELVVSVDEINGGFYDRANALQGNKGTYWTGAAWQAYDSSLIWNFTEYNVLPKIIG
jgi:hypothetical protein